MSRIVPTPSPDAFIVPRGVYALPCTAAPNGTGNLVYAVRADHSFLPNSLTVILPGMNSILLVEQLYDRLDIEDPETVQAIPAGRRDRLRVI